MSKPSPGPWRFEDGWIVDRDGNVVSRHIQDNGPLMAAAPEMLELLREEPTFPPDSEMGYQPECPGSYRARVRALLARIDGDQATRK